MKKKNFRKKSTSNSKNEEIKYIRDIDDHKFIHKLDQKSTISINKRTVKIFDKIKKVTTIQIIEDPESLEEEITSQSVKEKGEEIKTRRKRKRKNIKNKTNKNDTSKRKVAHQNEFNKKKLTQNDVKSEELNKSSSSSLMRNKDKDNNISPKRIITRNSVTSNPSKYIYSYLSEVREVSTSKPKIKKPAKEIELNK